MKSFEYIECLIFKQLPPRVLDDINVLLEQLYGLLKLHKVSLEVHSYKMTLDNKKTLLRLLVDDSDATKLIVSCSIFIGAMSHILQIDKVLDTALRAEDRKEALQDLKQKMIDMWTKLDSGQDVSLQYCRDNSFSDGILALLGMQ